MFRFLPTKSLSSVHFGRSPGRICQTCHLPIRSLRTARQSGPRAARRHEPIAPHIRPTIAKTARSSNASLESGSLALDHYRGQAPQDEHGILDKTRNAAVDLVSAPTLVICRQIEMMNIFIGFEQSNKYIIYDSEGKTVGFIAEDSQTMTGTMVRNLAGTHRPFSCVIMDTSGNVVLRVQRPFAFVNSYIKIFLVDGEQETLIGEVRQVFHFLRRKYELYLSRDGSMVQFGMIDEPTLSWDFAVKDEDASTIGSISRNLRGLVRELFSDTGMYVLRMSQTAVLSSTEVVAQGESDEARTAIAATQSRALVGPQKRPMKLDERAVLLATAVAVDFDYFSKMSNSHGMGMGMPMFLPMGGSYGTGETTPAGDSPTAVPSADAEQSSNNQSDEAPQSTGNWWDEQPTEQAPSQSNWWDQNPPQSEQGGSWLDGFDFDEE